ncbi:hypothetical protein DNTS_034523 [Danionella cerebrum]|uniref:Uncharacterized protein n=1 Tax=Danionella cerebrum TaxID=2873325 RepID=A0A553MPK5_9TELE|nr:hypothetical protein DNTS_034523 [Danionella translucida]
MLVTTLFKCIQCFQNVVLLIRKWWNYTFNNNFC